MDTEYVAIVSLALFLFLLPVNSTAKSKATDIKDVCQFFSVGRQNIQDPWAWGPYHICDAAPLERWHEAARANCMDCAHRAHVCGYHAPALTVHMWMNSWVKKDWRLNLYAIKSFLMTQNLVRTRLSLWLDDKEGMVTNHPSSGFFRMYSKFIDVHQMPPWPELVSNTPLEKDPFWGNHDAVIKAMNLPGAFADIIRYLLLYKHGGLWVDTDFVFLQDAYPLTIQVGYQFLMRWTNVHVIYLKQASSLAERILRLVASMPYTSEEAMKEYVEKICKPKGYFSLGMYGYQDVYNVCVGKIAMQDDNDGPSKDAILYDQPLGWWDQDWPSCIKMRYDNNDTARVDRVLRHYMGIHSRHLKDQTWLPNSTLHRAFGLIDDFFDACPDTACLPLPGTHLTTFADVTARLRSTEYRHRRRRGLRSTSVSGGSSGSGSGGLRGLGGLLAGAAAGQGGASVQVQGEGDGGQ